MSDSTTQLDTISSSQAQKEVSANALFDAMSPAAIFGRRARTSDALTFGYYGGDLWVDGVLTTVANGTVALSASTTNYVEATRAGVVSKNTTGFTAGQIPLYTIVTGASTVTSYTDHRLSNTPFFGRIAKSVAGGAGDTTLTAAEARADSFEFTGALTGNRNVIMPTVPWKKQFYNNTSGAFTLTVKTSAGTGIAVTQTKRIALECDGVNVVVCNTDISGGGASGAKMPVRVATTANITLSGGAPNTLDGATLAANDRILVKNQSTASENGIYYVSTLGTGANGTWTRATDADGAGDMFGGMLVSVSEGTVAEDSLWMLTTDDPITLGTTALTFVSPGEYVESVVADTSAISLANGTPVNITSISLVAGDWDVIGSIIFLGTSTTSITSERGFISLASNTRDISAGRIFGKNCSAYSNSLYIMDAFSSAVLRFKLTATTTIYLVAEAEFTVSTMSAYGIISARRVR